MDATPATLVWIAPEAPSAEAARAAVSWARARGVVLEPPAVVHVPPKAVDLGVAEEVEGALDRARDALAAHDTEATERALAAAESTLRAHPELPQAAWLMAEVERARAARLRRLPPVDEAAGERAWRRADALDGGRAAGVGEKLATGPGDEAALVLDGVPAGASVVLDGVPQRGPTVATRAGRHDVVVLVAGAPAWAAWLDVGPGTTKARAEVPLAPACSTDDVGAAHAADDGSVRAEGVRCASWVAAVPTADGARFAVCEVDRCGPLLEWHAPVAWTYDPPPVPAQHRWPAWATWTLVSAGAVVAASVAVAASGVLSPAPTETRFVSGGVRTQ